MSSRVQIQTPNGKKVLLDQIRESIYDTITIANGDTINTTREFFSNIQGKKLWQTNLNQANLLEKNVSFKILSMNLVSHALTYANKDFLPSFIQKTSLRLQIGDRDMWKGSAREAAGDVSVMTNLAGDTDREHVYAQLGTPCKHGVVFGKDAHEIPSLFTFKVIAETSDVAATVDAGESLDFQMRLYGLKRRPYL